MRADKKTPLKGDKKVSSHGHKRGAIGYSKKSALLEDAITQMNAGKYGRSSAALKELLALDPLNMEARRLFATLHLRLGSLLPARQAFESLANEALERQDYWLAESLLREYLVAGPRCVPFIEKLGAVYQEKGDALAAAEEFAKAIDILVEDPDPDRPTHPAELYAKIRELAPASPPAFRLAALFDTQSGDLIPRQATASAPQPDDVQAPSAVHEALELGTSPPSTTISDPVSGAMPWDDVPEAPPVWPSQSQQPGRPDATVLPEMASREPVAESVPAPVASLFVGESSAVSGRANDSCLVESGFIPPSLIPFDARVPSDVAMADIPSTLPPVHQEMPSAEAASFGTEWNASPQPISQDSWEASPSAASSAVEAEHFSQSDAMGTLEKSASELVPAPLPWEQIQESTIAIPQADAESLPADPSPAEPIRALLPDAVPLEPVYFEPTGEAEKGTGSPLAEVGTSLSSATTEACSPDITWSAPDAAVTEPVGASPMSTEPFLTSSLPEEQQPETAVESVSESSSIPWEQVQEALLGLDGSGQESAVAPASIMELSAAEPQQTASAEIIEQIIPEGNAASPDSDKGQVPHEIHSTVDAAPSSTSSSVTSVSEVSPKVGEFSWASIFNSSWKFGSSSPAPHDSLHHSVTGKSAEPVESVLPVVAAVPARQEQSMAGADAEEGPEVMPIIAASPIEAVAAPLPWDQIQETPVTIPPAEITLTSDVETVGACSPAPMVLVETSHEPASSGASTMSASIETSAVLTSGSAGGLESIELPPDKSVESSFHFAEATDTAVEPVPSEEVARAEFSLLSSGTNEAAPLQVASPVEDEGGAPVHSEEFRLVPPAASSVPAQEATVSDALVTKVDRSPAMPVEPAAPVLPRELLPVLQTLVDQLSVVTKTIPAVSADTKPPEPVASGRQDIQGAAPTGEMPQGPSSVELAANPAAAQMPPAEVGPPSQWQTGEVAVQAHRPSENKRARSTEQVPEPLPIVAPVVPPQTVPIEPVVESAPAVAESATVAAVPTQEKEEWIRTGEAIRFVNQPVAESAHLAPPPYAIQEARAAESLPSTAASAVDVLFQSSGRYVRTQTGEHPASPKPRPRLSAKLARVRIGLLVFVGSCFSTTHALATSIVGLAVLCVAMVAMAVGAVGLTWLVMEEKPSPSFQSLTTTPQRTMMDSGKNGYLLLLGFEADASSDPVQAGYERKPDAKDGEMAAVCQGDAAGGSLANQKNASASVAQGWYRSADPLGQFKAQADNLKGWTSQFSVSIGRYRQWLKMSIEDWGHGQAVTPPCAAILFAHRLHVADGFSQGAGMEAGVERLEGDMEAWRTTLSQAKTLPVKMLALQAINDDIAVASGMLVRPDFDGKVLPRITKVLRPLDPVESSMRWPMQSQLVLAAKSYTAQLDADRGEEVPLHVSVATLLPLPKQRRFNDYAEYYEASYKAAGEGRYGAMPKRSTYITHPAESVLDYLTNPIENVVGLDPLPAWDHYNGLVIDTDAHLRLASLQAWLRRGPQDADLLARIAKAGQRFYDPYTGLPMLVNLRRGVMYSVGHDGKDQDADPQQDVVVSIPLNQPASTSVKSVPKSK